MAIIGFCARNTPGSFPGVAAPCPGLMASSLNFFQALTAVFTDEWALGCLRVYEFGACIGRHSTVFIGFSGSEASTSLVL